jgi:hypothetical protein
MPGTNVLDTALGLGFTFFLVAVLCSAAVEFIANVVKKRAKYLLRGLQDMLDTPTGAETAELGERWSGVKQRWTGVKQGVTGEKQLYRDALEATPNVAYGASTAVSPGGPTDDQAPVSDESSTKPDANEQPWAVRLLGHPLLRPFKQSRAGGLQTRNPAYLPANAVAAALLDLIVSDSQGKVTIDKLRLSVDALSESLPFKSALLALLKTAGDDLKAFQRLLEEWYDAQMDAIGGAYRRWARRWAIAIALVVAVGFQVDSIAIANSLYNDQPLRQAVVAAATNGTLCEQATDPTKTRQCVSRQLGDLGAQGLPVGWGVHKPDDSLGWLSKILGLAITAAAASLGAPFWFDVLNRMGSLRNVGNKPRSDA